MGTEVLLWELLVNRLPKVDGLNLSVGLSTLAMLSTFQSSGTTGTVMYVYSAIRGSLVGGFSRIGWLRLAS